MKLGIHIGTFVRPTLEQSLDAVVEYGLDCVHFKFPATRAEPLPEQFDRLECDRIAEAVEKRGLSMETVSGTFNMIHPDRSMVEENLKRLDRLAAVCDSLGTRVITVCTGTRDRQSMWRAHPDNSSSEAWDDLLCSMETALESASRYNIVLGVEPEVSNLIDSASRARRLLDTFDSPNLKIILDGANLFPKGGLDRMHSILDEAFDLLGDDLVLAHAKDIDHDGDAGQLAAGTGLLDYDYYLDGFRRVGYDGPLILHSLAENQVAASVKMLREKIDR
jgi:sugar phosphate isomerase/epimerase